MAYLLQSGIHVSLDNSTWYKLTDHNRSEIEISPEVIESSQRMANGKMRKYVVAVKNNISTSWEYVPSKTSQLLPNEKYADNGTVDQNHSAAWLQSFYKANAGVPIYVKIVSSSIDPDTSVGNIPSESNYGGSSTKSKTINAFMSNFSLSVVHRTPDRNQIIDVNGTPTTVTIKGTDYVNMSIEFTEI